jgi:hypothetical protein
VVVLFTPAEKDFINLVHGGTAMRKTLLIIALLLLVCGCDPSAKERIAAVKAVIDQAVSVSQSVDVSIADVNQTIASLELLANDPNVPADAGPQIQLALAAARSKINALIAHKQKVDAVLLNSKTILASIDPNTADPQAELNAYGDALKLTAPALPSSISGYVYLAGGLIPIFGGLAVKVLQQWQKIKEQKKILADAVQSVDKLLDPKSNEGIIPEDKVRAAKFILEHSQAGATSDAVDAIHNEINTATGQ